MTTNLGPDCARVHNRASRIAHRASRRHHVPFAIGHNESDRRLQWLNQAMQERSIYLERCVRLRKSFFPAEDWLVNQAHGVDRPT